ncbi:MAG: GNAT family N-acetyltransferase, partial [Planctomycetes bacterium]|nr:GNAT family N-acetyltransferase [Planctomycetota bacterium]
VGAVDYTPMELSDLQNAIEKEFIKIDVVFLMTTPPDKNGNCCLGISVDLLQAAVKHASLVIVQANKNLPITWGDTFISVDEIDYLVESDDPLIEVPTSLLDPVSLTIGRHIAKIIENGMTLHFDTGPISLSTMRYLDTKKSLGIHTLVLTTEIMRLIQSGVIDNSRKTIDKGKTVATLALGSHKLYEFLHQNPSIRLRSIDYVSNPFIIAQIQNMVSILSVQEIDLTGLARIDIRGISNFQSLPTGMDFLNGTNRAQGGFTIVGLYSTTRNGKKSRILGKLFGRGVFFNRSKVDFVVTEYGSVYLYGLSIRERTNALISIAHPKFRKQLLKEAKEMLYVTENQIIPPENGDIYPHHFETTQKFQDGLQVFFRPIKPYDNRRVQQMFYSLSEKSIRLRYHGAIKILSFDDAQTMTNIDYKQDMAIVGLVGPRGSRSIIAEARYNYNPNNNMGEFDIIVSDEFQSRGIGTFLVNYLTKIAYSRGLSGLYAEVLGHNNATMSLFVKTWPTGSRSFESGLCTFTVGFPQTKVNHPKNSILIYSGKFSDFSFGEDHPVKLERMKKAYLKISREGYLNEPWLRLEEPVKITREHMTESHDPGFIAALEDANPGEWKDYFVQYHLGGDDCPVFKGLFDYVTLYTAATITSVRFLLEENANVVFNLMGGFHHASRNFAEGFCYVNDVIVAIDMLLAQGHRVAYIDVDAHHGNGVQDAYYQDDRVLFISLHESGKTLYPWSGFENEIGRDLGKGYSINVPLPQETDDEAYEWIFKRVVTPAVDHFAPSIVVAVVGTDTHKNDPLSALSLTNNGMVAVMEEMRDYCNNMLLLGGGGYDMNTATNSWCRLWAAANRIDALPDYLSVVGGNFLGAQDMQQMDIIDMNYRISGEK